MTTIGDRVAIKVVAGVGTCAAALVLCPQAAATPLKTGGTHCLETSAGAAARPPMAPW